MGEVQNTVAGTGFRAVGMDIDDADGQILPVAIAGDIDGEFRRAEIDGLFRKRRGLEGQRTAIVAALIDKTGGVSGVIAGKQTPAGEWVEFPWEAIGAL